MNEIVSNNFIGKTGTRLVVLNPSEKVAALLDSIGEREPGGNQIHEPKESVAWRVIHSEIRTDHFEKIFAAVG